MAVLKSVWKFMGDTAREFVVDLGAISVHDKLSDDKGGGGKKTVGGAMATIVKKSLEQSRSELLAYLAEIDARRLMRRQEMRQDEELKPYKKENCPENRYQPGDENKFVELLTKLFRDLSGEQRKAVFKWLDKMSHKEFDAKLEFLNHDVIKQWLARTDIEVAAQINEVAAGISTIRFPWKRRI